ADRDPHRALGGTRSRRLRPAGHHVRDGLRSGRAADARGDAGESHGDGAGQLPLHRLLEARPPRARALRHRRRPARPGLLAVLTVRARDTAGRGVGASVPSLRVRWFAAPRDQPRARRGTDVVILVAAAIALGLAIAAYPPSASVSLPGWIARLCAFLADLLWLWALV